MIIGVIGIGVVGTAVYKYFKNNSNHTVIGYDKYKEEFSDFNKLYDSSIIFICLPTNYSDELKTYDMGPINENLNKLKGYNGIILLKSTVIPGTSQNLSDKYSLKIIHNPEFLTARTAYEDFVNQDHIVLGKTNNITDNELSRIKKMYSYFFENVKISISNSNETEHMKLFCNTFYSLKIQFFNELYLSCKKFNIDYDNVKDMMLKNNWINPMHTNVPGPDGKLSYGGVCFPKDTNALLNFMKDNDLMCEIIEATIKERNILRMV